MALSDFTASAAIKAIQEFDQLGRDSFLKKYGFGKARSYELRIDGRSYDSKANAALRPDDFSGGEATVQNTLERLGFTVINNAAEFLPSPGDVLTNEEIGRSFGVGNMGGMRRSNERNLTPLKVCTEIDGRAKFFTTQGWGQQAIRA